MSLCLIAKCVDCGKKMECPNIYSRSRLKRCATCRNRHKYLTRRLLLKVKRMKQKRCHTCKGMNQTDDVFCTPYCKWVKWLQHRSYKIILRLEDLK